MPKKCYEDDGWLVQEVDDNVEDPATARVCGRCGKIKDVVNFTRGITPRQALSKATREKLYTTTEELYERASILQKSVYTVHKMCNTCASKHRISLSNQRCRVETSDEYNTRLRVRNKDEFMVRCKTSKPGEPEVYTTMTNREALVLKHKQAINKAASDRRTSTIKASYAKLYSVQMRQVSNEEARIKMQAKCKWLEDDPYAVEFLQAYLEHLSALRQTIRSRRYAKELLVPEQNPFKYINYDSLVTKKAVAAMWGVDDDPLFTKINPRFLPTDKLVLARTEKLY